MRLANLFALLAISPVAVNAAPWAPPSGMLVRLCNGGVIHMNLPAPHHGGSQPEEQDQCLKACHAGCTRKRAV